MARVAIVTGSDSGIGRAVAVALGKDGFDVGITWYTDEVGANETARMIADCGRRTDVRRLDLNDPHGAAQVIDQFAGSMGDLAVLVNNAAAQHRGTVLEESVEDLSRILTADLTGQFACAQAAARHIVSTGSWGRIVNITSVQAHTPMLGGVAYCSAKAGLEMVTQVMALELGEYGITVNSVAPGHIATPATGFPEPDGVDERLPGIPVGRIGLPKEVAAAVSYLCSPEAASTTGTSLVVDGGILLYSVVPLQQAVEA